jgi:hypothetical protein
MFGPEMLLTSAMAVNDSLLDPLPRLKLVPTPLKAFDAMLNYLPAHRLNAHS